MQTLHQDALEAREDLNAKQAKKVIKKQIALLEAFESYTEIHANLSEDELAQKDELFAHSKATGIEASLAIKEAYIDKLTSSWKADAYYTGRRLGLASLSTSYDVTLQTLQTADKIYQSDEGSWIRKKWKYITDYFDDDELPTEVATNTADDITEPSLAETATHETKDPLVSPELIRTICSDPARLSMTMAAGFAIIGKSDLALYEISSRECLSADEPAEIFVATLIKSFIYSRNHCPNLAVHTLNSFLESELPPEAAEKFIAAMHLQIAAGYIQAAVGHHTGSGSTEYLKDAERHLGYAIRAWPNSPVTQFLTGEYLAASGRYEAAADSLSTLAENTDIEWLSEVISPRVKQFRDADPAAADQALFSDAHFIHEVLLRSLLEETKDNEHAQKIREFYEASQVIAGEVLLKLDPKNYL